MAISRVQALRGQPFMKPAKVQSPKQQRVAHIPRSGRWAGLDEDISDDQQDITRGRNMVDPLYQGGSGLTGTHNAVMASGTDKASYRRSWDKTDSKDGLYISPEFLDKMTVHIAKNFMSLPNVKVPLILGIWGGKGEGKTFQTELAYRRLNIDPVVMSAGELESDNAGEPAKLVRQRYREASEVIKKGQLCSLFINDLDAGAGRLNDKTQYTVNNQLVSATLMNIADNPHNVQLPGMYQKSEIPRVPIVCTGNDFSTLYAPLIRDGRMDKFFWNPTRDDRVGVCMGIFKNDTLSKSDIEKLVDSFPGQTIDFFGALRAKAYDDKVRSFIAEHGHENLGKQLVNARGGKVQMDVICDLNALLKYGNALASQQDNVKRVRLADAYLTGEF